MFPGRLLSADRFAGVHRVAIGWVLEWEPQPFTWKCFEAGEKIDLNLFWIFLLRFSSSMLQHKNDHFRWLRVLNCSQHYPSSSSSQDKQTKLWDRKPYQGLLSVGACLMCRLQWRLICSLWILSNPSFVYQEEEKNDSVFRSSYQH